MNYRLHYSDNVDWKRFQKLSLCDKKRMMIAIEQRIAVDPLRFGKPLQTSLRGCRSLRVGSYRIIYRIEKQRIEILLFGHRSTVYEEAKGIV
jgi:mRNA interferase RelE/StbE